MRIEAWHAPVQPKVEKRIATNGTVTVAKAQPGRAQPLVEKPKRGFVPLHEWAQAIMTPAQRQASKDADDWKTFTRALNIEPVR
jgi:hypothetical protein